MAEPLIEIGAVINTAGFTAGLRSMVSTTASVTKTMVRLFADAANEVQAAFDAVKFAAELLDQVATVNVQLGNLSQQSGIAIDKLGGLKLLVEQTGADFAPFADGLNSMRAAQLAAVQGNTSLAAAFQSVGISVTDLQKLTPEQLMYRMASGLKNTKDAAGATSGAMKIFGDSGAALIPILRGAGTELQGMTTRASQFAGVSNDSEQAGREWKQVVADLSASLRTVLTPALQIVVPAIRAVWSAFESAATIVLIAAQAVFYFVKGVVSGLAGLGKVVLDVLEGNFGAVVKDAVAAKDSVVGTFKEGGNEIKETFNSWRELMAENWTRKGITPDFTALPLPRERPSAATQTHGTVGTPKAVPPPNLEVEPRVVPPTPAPQRETPATMPQRPPERLPKNTGDTPEQERAEAQIEAEKALQQHRIAMAREQLDFEAQIGQASASEKLRRLKDLANQEYQIELQALIRKMQLHSMDKDSKEVTAAGAQMEKLMRDRELKLTQMNHQQLATRVTQFKEFFGQVTGGFRNMTKALMEGTKSIGQVWKETWNNIARNFVSKLQDMLMNWITQHLSMLFVRLTTNEAMVASDAAAQDKSTKISLLGTIKKIGHDAASAAAKAFKAVMEGVPYPLNFVLAPLAAAGTFAAVIGYQAFVKAEKGALLDQDQLVYAHKNEMILPAPLSSGLQKMVGLGVAPSPALRMPGGAAASAAGPARPSAIRNEHYNFNANISTIDAKGTAQWMRENSGMFYRLIRDGVRAGKLRPAEI